MRILAAVLFILLLSSCRKEPSFPSWDTDLLLPLVKSELDMLNIVDDTLLSTNPDNSLVLSYNSTFYSLTLDSLFKIPDTTITYSYLVPFSYIIVNAGDQFINATDQNQYQISGVELTRAIIRSGYMQANIQNSVHKRMKITFSMPLATKNSQPFTRTVTVPAAVGSVPGVFQDTFHLNGYDLDLRGPSMNAYNTVVTSTQGFIDPSDLGSDTIFAGEGVYIDLSFLSMVPQYARGYFGQTLYPIGPDSSSFDLFNKITSGVLNLEDATATLTLSNYIGVDSRTKIMDLTSVNTRNGNNVSLNHSIINSNINLNRAVDYNNGTVVPSVYSVTLNTSNSNFKTMLENLPDKFRYQLETEVNPNGNISGGNDFVYYGLGLNANLNLDIPLSLSAGNLTMVDTVDFTAIDPENNSVNYGNLTIYAENGFPFDCELKLRMLDENNNPLGELMPSISTIDEAPLGTNNIVSAPRMTQLVVPIPEEKMNLLEQTKKLRLQVVFNTSDYPNYIKIYSFYKIGIQVVGDFNYTVK